MNSVVCVKCRGEVDTARERMREDPGRRLWVQFQQVEGGLWAQWPSTPPCRTFSICCHSQHLWRRPVIELFLCVLSPHSDSSVVVCDFSVVVAVVFSQQICDLK